MTQDELKSILDYDPDTGIFTRLKSGGGVRAGSIAGCRNVYGYTLISVGNKRMLAHRLAFLWMTGAFPPADVDHIDGDRENNVWENLREATRSENMQNIARPKASATSGILGVTFDRSKGKWVAQIRHGGKNKLIGRFETAERAGQAYMEAKRALHPFSSRIT